MGNSASNDNTPSARFLAGCPPIPPCPADTEVQWEFDSLLKRKEVHTTVQEELNAMESTETKWLYCCLDKFLATPEAAATELLDPRVCIQEIVDPQRQLDSLHDLFRAVRINMMLRSNEWIERFVSAEGVQTLVGLLDPAKAVSEMVHVEALNALFALSHSTHGITAMVESSACCDRLLGLYTISSSNTQRGRVLKLLGVLCCHSQAAQSNVLTAIARRGSSGESVGGGGGSKYGLLTSSFTSGEVDRALQLAVVAFVNVVLNSTLDVVERVAIRDDLENNGLISMLEKYRVESSELMSTAMVMEIDLFFKSHANDRAKTTAPLPPNPLQRRLSLNIPAAADEPVTSSIVMDAASATIPGNASCENELATAQPATPQHEGPRSLQARKSLRLEMAELHTETEEVTGRPMLSPPPAPEPLQRRPSGSSLLPALSIPKLSVAFSSTKASGDSTTKPREAAVEVCLPKTQATTTSTETSVPSVTSQSQPSLESILAILQQGTKSLDEHTSQKLVNVLAKLASSMTTEGTAACGKVVDKLEQTLTAPDAVGASPVLPSRISLRLPTRYSDSDVYALAIGTPAKSAPHTTRFHVDDSTHRSTSSSDQPSRSPTHSHYEEEHSPRRSMTETESYDESSHEYEMKAKGKPSSAKVALAGFFQHLKKGQGLPTTPAPTPMATASVKKDARRPVFPSFGSSSAAPSPMPGHFGGSFALPPLTPLKPSISLSLPPLTPMRPQVVPTAQPSMTSLLSPRPKDEHLEAVKEEEAEAPSPAQKEAAAAGGPDISKFRKLLTMGAPKAAVRAKMQQAGVDPDLLDRADAPVQQKPAPAPTPPVAKEETPEVTTTATEPDISKFRKLLTMGAPLAAVKVRMQQAGLDPALLDHAPSAVAVPTAASVVAQPIKTDDAPPTLSTAVKIKDHPEYAKFFKLLSMGAPAAGVKVRMQQAGVNPAFLDTPDAIVPYKAESNNNAEDAKPEAPNKVLVKDHPDYARFFKLKTMAPVEVVKARMQQSGLDPELLDTPDAEMPSKGGPETLNGPAAPSKLGAGAALAGMLANRQTSSSNPSSNQNASDQPIVLVKDDPAYAKFFKLIAMGAPADTVKGKMQMAGLRPELLDTPDAPLNPAASSSGSSNQTSNNAGAPPAAPARRANLALSIKPAAKPTTRPLYWQHLKGDAIRGTIWEEIENEQTKENNELPLALADTDLGLLESEFPAQTAPMTGPSKQTRSMSMDQMPKELLSPRVVFLIDRGRANNISIIIKQFRMSHAAIREATMKADANVLTLERAQGLIKILPTDEEVAAITGYQGDPLALNEAERVLKELITVPRLKQRLTAMQARLQFPQGVRDLQQKVDKLRTASTEVGQSTEFKTVLQIVLQVGNRLNQNTPRGGAKGFRLGDLPKLSQLKAADKTSTLLHYVARMIRQKKGNAVRLSESLSSLYDVQNIPIPELPADMSKVAEVVEYVTNEVGAQKLKNSIEEKEPCDHFVKVMGEFLDTAAATTTDLKADLETMIRLLKETMQRFGFKGDNDSDDAGSTAPGQETSQSSNHAALASAGEFFLIIYEFSVALTKADRENEVKRLREEARAKQSLKPKMPALGPRSMSSRDMIRKPSIVDKKTSDATVTTAGSEAQELSSKATKDKTTTATTVAEPRTSPMLRQRSASLSSIVNNVNLDAVLSTLPAKSPSSMSSNEKPAAAAVSSIEKKASAGNDAAKEKTPTTTPSKETKPSSLKPPTKLVKPGAPSSDKDKSVAKPKPTIPLPGRIVKSSAVSVSASPKSVEATPSKAADFGVCYESPLGLTMPKSLEKAKTIEKPEFAEFTPFDLTSIEDIRAQLVKKHVSPDGNNNSIEASTSTSASTSLTVSKLASPSSPEESIAEIDLYSEAFDDDA